MIDSFGTIHYILMVTLSVHVVAVFPVAVWSQAACVVYGHLGRQHPTRVRLGGQECQDLGT